MPVARGVGRPPFATRLSTVIDSEQNKVIIYGYDDFFPSGRLNPSQSPTAAIPSQSGLSSDEARQRLAKVGPNAMPDTAEHPLRRAIGKFWAPVPWMLEAAIVLEVILGKYIEAAIIAVLLAFNAALGFFQESRAQATLNALKSRLAMNASVERDGRWKTVPAVELVPGRCGEAHARWRGGRRCQNHGWRGPTRSIHADR